MVKPIVEELKILEKEVVVVYDAFTHKEVLLIAPVLCAICNNPRASEITNTLGPGSRNFCRICTVITLPLLYLYFLLHGQAISVIIIINFYMLIQCVCILLCSLSNDNFI